MRIGTVLVVMMMTLEMEMMLIALETNTTAAEKHGSTTGQSSPALGSGRGMPVAFEDLSRGTPAAGAAAQQAR
jgi:hypothetical protein